MTGALRRNPLVITSGSERGLLGDLACVEWVRVVEVARERGERERSGGAVGDQEERSQADRANASAFSWR
jgi:hypothetical protein